MESLPRSKKDKRNKIKKPDESPAFLLIANC
jgi:hypothetical protein